MAKILFSCLFLRSQPFCRKMDKITKKDEILKTAVLLGGWCEEQEAN
jgi:hypothetical protein